MKWNFRITKKIDINVYIPNAYDLLENLPFHFWFCNWPYRMMMAAKPNQKYEVKILEYGSVLL